MRNTRYWINPQSCFQRLTGLEGDPVFESLRTIFDSLFGFVRNSPSESSIVPGGSVTPVNPHVLVVVYDPIVTSEGGHRLSKLLGWNNPGKLVQRYISDLRDASYGYCNYEVIAQVQVDKFPIKADGFSYTPEEYVSAWRARSGFHEPDAADYQHLVNQLGVIDSIDNGEFDEVWLIGPPYAGFYESRMAGPGAIWCNAPPLEAFDYASRRFVIMGFNYERGVGEMLESFGHRAESILSHVFRKIRGEDNLWERYIRYELTAPGHAEVGNVHFAPNSRRDYDWGNRTTVLSSCDNWLGFPDLSGSPRPVNSSEWGNGDTRLHHLWWLKHFPHVAGSCSSISHNWWEYVIIPSLVH